MRKIYSKPCLIIESFQLNAAVAASCAVSVSNTTDQYTINSIDESCPLDIGGDVVIFATTDCDYNPDGICYHAPEGTMLAIYHES